MSDQWTSYKTPPTDGKPVLLQTTGWHPLVAVYDVERERWEILSETSPNPIAWQKLPGEFIYG